MFLQKPLPWDVNEGEVAPEWDWFHDESFLSGGPLWEGGGDPYDYGDRAFTTLKSSADWQGGIPGTSVELNDAGRNGETIELTNFDATKLDGLTTFTYAVYFTFIGSNSADEDALGFMWSSLQGTNDVNAQRILVRYDSNANELDFDTFTASEDKLPISVNLEDGKPHAVVCRYDSPNADKSIWLDGVNIGSTGAQTGALKSTGHSMVPEVFGGHNVTGPINVDSPRVRGHGWSFHDRAWSDDEIRQWSADPSGPFGMRVPMAFFVPAVGGVANPWYAYAQQ